MFIGHGIHLLLEETTVMQGRPSLALLKQYRSPLVLKTSPHSTIKDVLSLIPSTVPRFSDVTCLGVHEVRTQMTDEHNLMNR
jgi:hypothetical protein